LLERTNKKTSIQAETPKQENSDALTRVMKTPLQLHNLKSQHYSYKTLWI